MTLDRYIEKLSALGARGFPTSVHFELTHKCNCSCRYCYLDGAEREDVPTGKVLDIITSLKNNGVLYLFLTGGELFVRPDILTILDHAVACDFFEIDLLTNGTLLTGEYLDFLEKHARHFRQVQVPVFSDDASENDAYMGSAGALEHTLTAMRYLDGAGIRVRLSLSVQSFNVRRIGEIMDTFERMNFAIDFSPYKHVTSRNCSVCEGETAYDFYRTLFAGLGKERTRQFRRILDEKTALPPRTALCTGISCMFMVDPAGTVFPCVSFRNYPLGNLLDEPDLRKLFTSDAMNRLRLVSLSDYPACAACQYANFCSICIGRWHTASGRFGCMDSQLCNFVRALADHAEP